MKRCDPRAPLMVNVTKMYPRPDASGFDSFGRVFSGQLKVGDKVSVLREGIFWFCINFGAKQLTRIFPTFFRFFFELFFLQKF